MYKISPPEYERDGIKIYLEKGKPALLEYLRRVIPTAHLKLNDDKVSYKVYCPSCGNSFSHSQVITGKLTGGLSGIAAGAYLGAQIGIAGGPFGAIAGTIPGAILGAVFGKNIGNNFDKPICPRCRTIFEMPQNNQIISEVIEAEFEEEVRNIAEYIILLSRDEPTLEQTKAKQQKLKEKFEHIKKKSDENQKNK